MFKSFWTLNADCKTSGIPPPGCTEPPVKKRPSIVLERFLGRKNADKRPLEEVP